MFWGYFFTNTRKKISQKIKSFSSKFYLKPLKNSRIYEGKLEKLIKTTAKILFHQFSLQYRQYLTEIRISSANSNLSKTLPGLRSKFNILKKIRFQGSIPVNLFLHKIHRCLINIPFYYFKEQCTFLPLHLSFAVFYLIPDFHHPVEQWRGPSLQYRKSSTLMAAGTDG